MITEVKDTLLPVIQLECMMIVRASGLSGIHSLNIVVRCGSGSV